MYQNKALDEFLENKPINQENKEADLKEVLLEMKRFDKVSSIKYNRAYDLVISFLGGTAILLITFFALMLMSYFEGHGWFSARVKNIGLSIGIPASIFVMIMCEVAGNFRSRRSFQIHKLFLTLSEKPYEIRSSWDSLFNPKLKVIIEENQYLEGGHVIKEKSRHFSAYIDVSKSSDSIVKAVMTMVQKAETTFK